MVAGRRVIVRICSLRSHCALTAHSHLEKKKKVLSNTPASDPPALPHQVVDLCHGGVWQDVVLGEEVEVV